MWGESVGRQKIGPSRHVSEALRLLGLRIREARTVRHWTRAELAERIGVSTPTIARIEDGYAGVSAGHLLAAAVAVGLPLYGVDDPDEITRMRLSGEQRVALLPQRVRRGRDEADDVDLDF